MSETKEATYKSLLQRMVHMTEQRDFDEDLMKEVYGALLPPRKFEAANEKVSRLTAERDDLSRKLAVAEGELKRAERIASMDSSRLVDERIRRIAELETQLAEAINSQVESTEQLEREREAYETLVKEAVELRKQIATPTSSGPADEGWMEKAWLSFYVSAGRVEKDRFLAALRAHAPAARYPEVVEFLDKFGTCGWSLTYNPHQTHERRADAWSTGMRADKYYYGSDINSACRAALDSRKERSDG